MTKLAERWNRGIQERKDETHGHLGGLALLGWRGIGFLKFFLSFNSSDQ